MASLWWNDYDERAFEDIWSTPNNPLKKSILMKTIKKKSFGNSVHMIMTFSSSSVTWVTQVWL